MKYTFFLFSTFYSLSLLAQSYDMSSNDGQTITTCSGVFHDSDPGSGHYSNNEDYTVTFCSGSTDLLHFDLGCGACYTNDRIHPSDTLYIYDGTGTSGTLLAAVTGNSGNGNKLDVFGGSSGGLLSLSSCITFRFVSNGTNNEDGWSMGISCVPEPTCSGNANPAPSDLFGGAPYICNLDGYCGNTSSNYEEDQVGNIGHGGGNCPTIFGGTIENNSWLQFQASATSVDFDFSVSGCGTDGIQVAVFGYNGTNFTRVTPCAFSDGSNNGNFTVTASTLVIGETYYMMIDGNAGADCDYIINVDGPGVAVLNAGADQVICNGNSATLTATGPIGATYTWEEVGGGFGPTVGTSVSVSPAVTTSYVIEVTEGGICETQTDTVLVTVNACGCAISNLVAGTQTACVPGTNTYTQEVIVTYSSAPGTGTLDVNGQSFAITSSPQTVILTNLTANGNAVDVTATFSDLTSCTMTTSSLFTAPSSCSAPCAADNGTWD